LSTMRWLSFLLLSTLPYLGLAAKKTSEERFQEFHAKALSSTPVKLSDTTYKRVTSTPRDYTVAVLLTALENRFGCQLCREFQPEWELLAKSWAKGDKKGDSRLIFGTLDFSDGRDTFVSLGLQTAPVLFLFPPTTGPHAVAAQDPLRYDFASGPQTAEQVHSWIARHTPDRPHPPVSRPVNWMKWIISVTLTLGGGTAAVLAWPYMQPVLTSRRVWSAGSLIAILLFISGTMFNHIRKVPYVAGDGKGGISYIAGGFQNQFGLETQLVAAMYGALAFVTIGLVSKAPAIADP